MDSPATLHLETCTITMHFSAVQLPRALEILRAARLVLKGRPGCRSCRIDRDAEKKSLIRYSEEWDDADAFRLHLQSQEFLPVLIAIELASREPEVFVGGLTGTPGLKVIEELRRARNDGGEAANHPVRETAPEGTL